MSERGERVIKSLQSIIDYQNGDTTKCRVRVTEIPNIEPITEYSKEKIKEIRQKTNLPQKYFADLVGVTPRAVEAWESGTRKPTGTAKRIFQMIDRDPAVINSMMIK